MGSAFFGIGIGAQGLYTAKTSLNITNHNITNAETIGYSRQYGVQSATRALPNNLKGMIGTGSEITNIAQHRDAYLDYKYWSMTNEMGEYTIKNELTSQMELIFNEPSDTGYNTYLNNVFESLQTLSKDPSNTTLRGNMVDTMSSFSKYMNDLGEQLINIQKEANFGLKTKVDQINFFAQQLGTLNHQIGNIELNGSHANDLRDERNRIIDKLSKIINIEAKEITDINGKETFRVSINGQILVDDITTNYLKVQPRETLNNPEDYVDMYDVYWQSGRQLYLDNDQLSGEIKGYVDIRDGNNGDNFNGEVISGQGTSTVVIGNPSRTDLPSKGELKFGGTWMRYNSYTYDSATDQMTFQLNAPSTVDGGQAKCEDIYGNDFTGTIAWDSNTQVRLTNVGNQDLKEKGTINLDGIMVTYTGYSKNPVAPNEITLTIQTPNTIDGTDMSMGDNIKHKGIPYYLQQLNQFVRTLSREFNELNESGNGGAGTQLYTYEGYTGVPPLDVTSDYSYEQIDIHNFVLNENIIDNLDLIETSTELNYGESANDIILAMIDKQHDTSMFRQGEPGNFMESVIGDLGIDAKEIINFKNGQENLLLLVGNQRLSVSGVDLNEETTNLIKFQQAYNTAAKIISVMDEIYDTTINRMGV